MVKRGNGSGSISDYKTSKGKKRYRVRITTGIEFDEVTGKTKVISKSLGVYDTRKEAEIVLANYLQSPYDLGAKIKTVEDLYKAWSKEYFEKIAPSAVRSVTSTWSYCDEIKKLPIQRLGRGHIEKIMKEGKRKVIRGSEVEYKPASINTQLRIKSMFNLMLDYAVSYKILTTNYARSFDVKDMRKEADYQKKIKIPFSNEEIKLFWKNLDEFPFMDMILIQIYSGWRPIEITDLKVKDIHLDENYMQGGRKTEAGTNRKVPIHPLIKPLIEKRYNQAIEMGSQWLFNDRFSTTGTHVTIDKYRHRFEVIMKYLGIKDRTMHCGRVTFITMAYASGLPENIIKRIVGHSLKANVTDGVYNYVTIDQLYRFISMIPKYTNEEAYENIKANEELLRVLTELIANNKSIN